MNMSDARRQAVNAFRQRYRAGIAAWYSPWLHGGFVLAWGLGVVAMLLGQVQGGPGWAWLAVPVALCGFNAGEYFIHKNLGHHKRAWAKLFYQRHTGDHHSFFVEGRMHFEQSRDFRVIFFPPWLVVVFSVAVVLPVFMALRGWSPDVAALSAATLMLGYLSYEVVHACEHLPDHHPVSRLPGVRHMRRLHELHHRPDLMGRRNFNIVFPLTDWVMGTLHRE